MTQLLNRFKDERIYCQGRESITLAHCISKCGLALATRFVAVAVVFLNSFGEGTAYGQQYIDVDVTVINSLNEDENQNNSRYLRDTLQLDKPIAQLIEDAERELMAVRVHRSAQCVPINDLLSCSVTRYPVLEKISINGLPLLVLEKELLAKLPIRIGDIVTEDLEKEKFSQQRVEGRVQTFLQANGFYGSKVRSEILRTATNNSLTLAIDISGSEFLRVHKVNVNGFSPIPASEIKRDFRTMCMSLESGLTVLAESTVACFSHTKVQEAISQLKTRMDALGYYQASIRAIHKYLPLNSSLPESCKVTSGTNSNIDSKCVEIFVNIEAGPKVIVAIHLANAQTIELTKTGMFFRNVIPIEIISRAVDSSLVGAQWPADETIIINNLRRMITFGAGRIVDQSEIDASAEQMKTLLAGRGYYSAQISTKLVQDPKANRIYVDFDITPGDPVHVEEIRVISNTDIPHEEIISKSDLNIAPRSFFSTGHFNVDTLAADLKQVEKFFRYQGYAEVSVRQNIILGRQGGVKIAYTVEVGERKTIRKVSFEGGVSELSEAALPTLAVCSIEFGAEQQEDSSACHRTPYVPALVEDDIQLLNNYYHSRGYMYTDVKASISEQGHAIDLVFHVKQIDGKAADKIPIVGILLNGNRTTHPGALLRHAGLANHNGNLTPRDFDLGLAKLSQTRLFSRVSADFIGDYRGGKRLYADINLVEKPTLTLDSSFSLSTDELFALDFTLSDKNIFGTMLATKTQLTFGLFWGRLTVFKNSLIWPRIYGSDFELELTVPLLRYRVQPNIDPPKRHFYGEISAAIAWALSNEINPYFKYTLRLDKWTDSYVPFNIISDPSKSIRTIDGLISVLQEEATSFRDVFRPGINYSNVDNPFFPHKGIRVDIFVELSPQFIGAGGPPYSIFGTQIAGYIPCGPLILASQFIGRKAIINDPRRNWWVLAHQSDMGALGGDSSVRGYADGDIGVWGEDIKSNGDVNIVDGITKNSIHTGDLSVQGNLELRYFHADGLGGALFVDFGYVDICDKFLSCNSAPHLDVRGRDTRLGLSVGLALSYLLPIGPISIAYAISPINTSDGVFGLQDRVHFLFGFTF